MCNILNQVGRSQRIFLLLLPVVLVCSQASDALLFVAAKAVQANDGDRSAAERKSAYRIHAESHEGDATRGKAVFDNDKKGACRRCHSSDPNRKSVGPDLIAIGDKFQRRDLIASVLEPSKTIAVGYGATIVVLKSGLSQHGVLQRVTNASLELLDKDSRIIGIPTADIDEQQTVDVSMMPEGLEAQMTPSEFVDLIDYLGSLKQVRGQSPAQRAVPDEIPSCAKGAEFVSDFDDSIRLDRPVWFGKVPGGANQFVVLEHFGKAWVVQKHQSGDSQTLLLDLTQTIRSGGATGLLGFAFHPQFTANRRYFIKYQVSENGQIVTIVDERKWAGAGNPEPGVEPRRLLRIVGSTQDHNGGCLAFGPDGNLYIGMGDSGPQGDPQGHGQDLQTLLGKILRIDVDRQDEKRPYAIPQDNPFRNSPESRPEIWAYGFREPWRFSFDSSTGELWVGDVGQNRYEEVSIVKAGENHGWNVYEGQAEHSNQFRGADKKFVMPVLAYPRRLGVSVTGGYVYRGQRAPQLQGWYIFGDFESRRIWALRQTDRKIIDVVEIGRATTRIASFSEDDDGELSFVGYDAGKIFRMNLGVTDLTQLVSRSLAETSENAPVLWHYSTERPTDKWPLADFDDASWKTGPAGFGTAGTPGGVVRTDWNSNNIWLRRKISLTEVPSSLESLYLRIHHDEDAVVYLNGVETARLNRWTTGYIDVPIPRAAAETLKRGQNILAIHCRQTGGGQFIDAGLTEYVRPKK